MSECCYPNCARECAGGPCPYCREGEKPLCKDKGGQIGMLGECLYCTAEAGETCK
jgi:hypothetical protein